MPISAEPGPGHDRLHVGEVQVDQAGRRDQVGDALHTGEQHLVGRAERVHQPHADVAELQQPVVGDDDQGVALVAQRGDALLGLPARRRPSKENGLVTTPMVSAPELARDRRHHRRSAGAGAAALASGDEDHVGALEDLLDLLAVLLGGLATHLGVRAGAETPGQLAADVELDVGVRHQQRLCIGVHRDELDALEPDLDHAVDGVDAAAADADDLDHREVVVRGRHPRTFQSGSGWACPARAVPAVALAR